MLAQAVSEQNSLIEGAGVAVVFAAEAVCCPQQDVQAGVCHAVLGCQGLPQDITPAAAACQLFLQTPIPHHPVRTSQSKNVLSLQVHCPASCEAPPLPLLPVNSSWRLIYLTTLYSPYQVNLDDALLACCLSCMLCSITSVPAACQLSLQAPIPHHPVWSTPVIKTKLTLYKCMILDAGTHPITAAAYQLLLQGPVPCYPAQSTPVHLTACFLLQFVTAACSCCA